MNRKPPRDPISEAEKALKVGLRVLAAARPLQELQNIGHEYESRKGKPHVTMQSGCKVCNGTYMVGEPPDQVNCPSCVAIEEPGEIEECRTCRGRGRVGAKNHTIPCPVCEGTGKR